VCGGFSSLTALGLTNSKWQGGGEAEDNLVDGTTEKEELAE
jgi:hypothetical protein